MRPTLELETTVVCANGRAYLEITGGDILLPVLKNMEGSKFLASLFKTYRKRTDRQNRYIWGVMVPCVRNWIKETEGEVKTDEEVYYFLRSLVGDKLQISNIGGFTVPTLSGKRFSQMSTAEFSSAIEKIYRHFSQQGLTIPPPTGECLLSDYVRVR